MKIIIEVESASDDPDMVIFTFSTKGKANTMPVWRAIARMSRVINTEYNKIHAESEYIKLQLESED